MHITPELSKVFLTETILRSNKWDPDLLTNKKLQLIKEPYVTNLFTDFHFLQFLEKWEEQKQVGIWKTGKTKECFDEWRPEWEKNIQVWIQSLGLPKCDIGWFFQKCKYIWWGEWRERNAITEHIKIVSALKKIIQPEQRSLAWYAQREGMITASDWAAVIGMNPYNSLRQFLDRKSGIETPFKGNEITQFGVKYECVANKIYERRMDISVCEFGLLPHPLFSFLGASPDGITNDGRMLEIKCPPKRLITGIPPKYYWVQMQSQLEICGLDRCDFLECKFEETVDYKLWENIQYKSEINSIKTCNVCWEWGTLPRSPDTIMEKGMVAEFSIGEKLYYTYWYQWKDNHPEKWMHDQESQTGFIRTVYWYLTHISCIPIYRDQDFFTEIALPKLAQAWNGVLLLRDQPAPGMSILTPPTIIEEPSPENIKKINCIVKGEPMMLQKKELCKLKGHGHARNPFLDGDLS